MYSLNKSPLDKDEQREKNKARARKMVLAMMVEVYL